MRILAIETVDRYGSVAACDAGQVLAEQSLDTGRRSAQTLVPGIADLLKQVGWAPGDVQLVAVATGPGSFTGLRIGVTTAKTFAYATGCQVLGVDSMTVIAARAPVEIDMLSVAVDAQREELFVADLTRTSDGRFTGQQAIRVVPAREWLAALPADRWVTGPGLLKWQAHIPAGARRVADELWQPTAEAVGRSAWNAYQAGERGDVWGLVPVYIRRTAAEEKWDERHASSTGDKNTT